MMLQRLSDHLDTSILQMVWRVADMSAKRVRVELVEFGDTRDILV